MFDLTFDCVDALRVAEFWKLALGYDDEPAPAPFADRSEWLASYGEAHDPRQGAWLFDPAGVGPRLSILAVPPACGRAQLEICRVGHLRGGGRDKFREPPTWCGPPFPRKRMGRTLGVAPLASTG